MTLTELKLYVDRAVESATRNRRNPDDITVYIRTEKLGTLGHVPVTGVKSINLGFDWEANSCLINPEKTLREIELDELEQLRKKYDEFGRKIYENRGK